MGIFLQLITQFRDGTLKFIEVGNENAAVLLDTFVIAFGKTPTEKDSREFFLRYRRFLFAALLEGDADSLYLVFVFA